MIYVIDCISSALSHIHGKGILHRDIKPENIGLDKFGRPYLTDFGISTNSTICRSSSGTLPYLAPEVLAPGNAHSFQADYWSLGVVAYELMYGRRPFSKHCPVEFIRYVSDNYEYLWKEKEIEIEKETEGEEIDQSVSFSTSLLSPKSPTSNAIEEESNFESIRERRLKELDHLRNVNQIFDKDELLIAIPSHRSTKLNLKESVDESFVSLVHGLLEVRIPSRLGNFPHSCSRFESLTSLKFLKSLNVVPCLHSVEYTTKLEDLLIGMKSPLLDDDSVGYLSGSAIFHTPI